MNTRCLSCGAKITSNCAFCPNCGSRMQEQPTPEPAAPLTGDIGYHDGDITQDNSQHDNRSYDTSRQGASIGGGIQFVIGSTGGADQKHSMRLSPCPICGRKNEERNTFRCRLCGRDFICLDHQDPQHFVCIHCAEEINIQTASAEPQPAQPQVVLCPVCGRRNSLLETFFCHHCGRDHLCLTHQDDTLNVCCDCLPKQSPSSPEIVPVEKQKSQQNELPAATKQRAVTPSEQRNIDFWTGLLARAGEKTTLHARISPSKGTWIATAAGMPGVFYQYRVWKDKAAVELYIDGGSKNKQLNNHRLKSVG